MASSRTLTLPTTKFPYLVHQEKWYRVVWVTDDLIGIKRSGGTDVEVPIATVWRCHERLLASPGRTLDLQEVPAGKVGQSVVGAFLVAAGLAKVVGEKPIRLLGIS